MSHHHQQIQIKKYILENLAPRLMQIRTNWLAKTTSYVKKNLLRSFDAMQLVGYESNGNS